MRTSLASAESEATTTNERSCECRADFDGDVLRMDATGCPFDGRFGASRACRATAVDALVRRDVDAVVVENRGRERAYEGAGAALLVAAGRFAAAAPVHDERLARLARVDPLRAAVDATGRAGAVGRLAAETGLAEAARFEDYEAVFQPTVGPTISASRVRLVPPDDATLRERRDLDTDAVVRIYERPDDELPTYHLRPVEHGLDPDDAATLATCYDRLAEGAADRSGSRGPGQVVRDVADGDAPLDTLAAVLRKHTRGVGVLRDLFADPEVTDVYASAPVAETPLRLTVAGERMRTNVRLTTAGAEALASRFRCTSGRAFSRASPTLDLSIEVGDQSVRVAGLTEPASPGTAFAFRASDPEPWTLPALVANGTLSVATAAFLSLAVERGVACLVAGPRGAGKTTLLGALLWELPAGVRTVVVEDTPELPVGDLQSEGRDVQRIAATVDGPGLSPEKALRAALRLGEGALVVGEVRGEETSVLYEAMRVGANASAVLGTIHGDGGADVRERVVSDLGVPATSFSATDLIVTLETATTPEGSSRRVRAVEEVIGEVGDRFESLYDRPEGDLRPSNRIERGNSDLVASLAAPDETYADVRTALTDREAWLESLVADGRTGPGAVVRAHARRRNG